MNDEQTRRAWAKVAEYRSNASAGFSEVWTGTFIAIPSLTALFVEAYRFIAKPDFLIQGQGWGDVAVVAISFFGLAFGGIKAIDGWKFNVRSDIMADQLEMEIQKKKLE